MSRAINHAWRACEPGEGDTDGSAYLRIELIGDGATDVVRLEDAGEIDHGGPYPTGRSHWGGGVASGAGGRGGSWSSQSMNRSSPSTTATTAGETRSASASQHRRSSPQQDEPEEAEGAQEVRAEVDAGVAVVQRHVVVRRDDDHEVRCHPVGALGSRGLPVREVAHPNEHGHADLVDMEGDAIVTLHDVGNGDRRQRLGFDRLSGADHGQGARVGGLVAHLLQIDSLPLLRPVGRGHGGPRVLVLEP